MAFYESLETWMLKTCAGDLELSLKASGVFFLADERPLLATGRFASPSIISPIHSPWNSCCGWELFSKCRGYSTAGRSLQDYLPKDFQGLPSDNHSSGGVLLWILRAASTPQDPVYSSQGRKAAPESGPHQGQAQHWEMLFIFFSPYKLPSLGIPKSALLPKSSSLGLVFLCSLIQWFSTSRTQRSFNTNLMAWWCPNIIIFVATS